MSTAAKPQQAPTPEPVPPRFNDFDGRRHFLIEVGTAGDIVLGVGVFALVLALRSLLGVSVPLNWPTLAASALFLGLVVCGNAIVQHRTPGPLRVSPILAAAVAASTVIYPALFFDRSFGRGVSRLTLLLFEVSVVVAIVSWRELVRAKLASTALQLPRNLILVGDRVACAELAGFAGMQSSVRVQEIITDDSVSAADAAARLQRIEYLVRTEPIDEILLVPSLLGANPARSEFYERVTTISECTRTKMHVCVHWLRGYDRVRLDFLGGQPLLSFSFSPDRDSWPLLLKRLIDILLAGLGLALTAPVIALAAAAILLESGRPILFSQTRPGLRGRPFRIYKLRTMVADAERQQTALESRNEVSRIAFKLTDDPRITRVGRWLRKTSIDELPQLVNVLKGNMSIIGPRPIPCSLDRYDIDHLRRLAMKPGITGLWQVSGRNRIADFDRWLELDTQYIRTWSLRNDLIILLRTVWAVVSLTGR